MKQNLKRPKLVHGVMLLLMLLFSGFTTFNLQAQAQIKGTVLDAGGNPIPGVSVLQKGTSNGVVTDFDGIYSMKIKNGQKILIFSYLGFKTQEVSVDGKAKLNVVLEESAETLEEIVIVGYQAVKRDNILGAVSGVKAASIAEATPVDALQGVQGKLSGVQIVSNNGPGEGFDIRIRGISTLSPGATGPLYVVDGQQTFNIDNLDPSDIENLEVLKDGASTAIYGSQGANGVVLITTKSGKEGKVKLSITAITGVNSLVGEIPQATATQRIQQERTQGWRPGVGLDTLSLISRNSPDIQDLVTRPSLRNQFNVALSGGSEKARFYWNTGFLKEEGLVIGSGFQRVNTRMKLDITPNEKFTIGFNSNLSYEKTNSTDEGAVLRSIVGRIVYLPLFNADGTFVNAPNGRSSLNPVQQAALRKNERRNHRLNLSSFVKYNFTNNLSVRSSANLDFRYDKRELFVPSVLARNNSQDAVPTGRENHFSSYRIQQDNVLNFDKVWGDKHEFKAFVGNQTTRERSDRLNVSGDFITNDVDTFNNTVVETVVANAENRNGGKSIETGSALLSYFAGVNYNYAGKYLFGATVRRDGSSRFGPKNKFGYFPSGSIGWNAAKEDFLKDNKLVKNLLFRYSYGIVGNDRIGDFDFSAQLEPGFSYNSQSGLAVSTPGNPNLKWEETTSQNLGFDLSLFKGRRLNLSADVWRKDVDGLLVNTRLPRNSGFNLFRENRGNIRNQGIDFSIDGTIYKKKGFSYSAGFNIGILENEVTKLETPIFEGTFVTREGGSIGDIFGYETDGIYRWDESNAYAVDNDQRLLPNFDGNGFFLGTYNRQDGTAYTGEVYQLKDAVTDSAYRGGDIIWKDNNGDRVLDQEDRAVIGNGLATITGGFNHNLKYKNITLSTSFDYSFGNDIYRFYDHERDPPRASVITPSPQRLENSWVNPGDIARFPVLAPNNTDATRRNSLGVTPNGNPNLATANTDYVDSGDFIKWRYIRLGYRFPKDLVEGLNFGLNTLKLDLAINNVLTWTNYQGYNPEFGTRGNPLQPSQDNLRYPNDREVLLTLKVEF